MAPKKSARGASGEQDEIERTRLRAILLADTFNLKFRPITLQRPKVLLPLVNTPMIDYTLEWLESVKVEEVYVFCCAHADQVKDYINKSDWVKHSSFSIHIIESNFATSAGDALRFIEPTNVISGDFILITGHTICNMSLTSFTEALQLHKERRKLDPDTVMTMFVKQTKSNDLTHLTRLGNDEVLMAIDPDTKQLLHYEDKYDPKRSVVLDKSLLIDNPSIILHNDLEDCCIDICSSEVLTIILDNFDYQHLRRHFVKGLLVDDIMGKKIYIHDIESSYAARVDNYRSYDTISKDIILRWPYPLVPDVFYTGTKEHMRSEREAVYKAPDTTISPSATIGPCSAIGSGTIIGDNSTISCSVIGESCTIGKNVSIHNCYIWGNVIIEDGCKLNYAIVCDEAHLRAGVILEPGVILSFEVEVEQSMHFAIYSKISSFPQPSKQDSDEELEYADSNAGVIDTPSIVSISPKNTEQAGASFETEGGISKVWYIWTSCNESGNEEDWKYSIAPIPEETLKKLQDFAIEEAKLLSEEENSGITHSGEIITDSKSTDFESDANEEYKGDVTKFEKEVEETFERALGGVSFDNVKLEINSLRLSYNVSHEECAGAVFQSVIKSALIGSQTSTTENLRKSTMEAIEKWKGLLCHFITSNDDEIEVILKFEEICMETNKEFAPIFSSVLHQLYDKDVISEDAVLSWAEEKDGADESDKIFVKQSEAFITWLKDADEEEEDDE